MNLHDKIDAIMGDLVKVHANLYVSIGSCKMAIPERDQAIADALDRAYMAANEAKILARGRG